MRPLIVTFMALVFLVTTSGSSAAQPANSTSSTSVKHAPERVRVLYRNAEAAFLAKDFESSRKQLLEAWSIQPNVDVALSLGQTNMQLKLYAEATTYLEYAIEHFLPSESEELLKTVKATLSEARTHVGQLTIQINRDGADVRIDGKFVGISPLAAPVFVDPGRHELSAQLDASKDVKTIEIVAGNSTRARLELPQDAPKPQVAHIEEAPGGYLPVVPASASEPSLVPVIIGGAVFALGVGTAVGFGLAANSKDNTAKALRSEHGPSGCAGSATAAASCSEQYDAARTGDRYYNLSRFGMVMAGVALVATPAYWFWPRASTSTSSARRGWSLDASANPRSAHLHLSLDF